MLRTIALLALAISLCTASWAQSQTVTRGSGGAQVVTGSRGWSWDSALNRLYDNQTVVTFSGTVIGVQTSTPINGMEPGVSILVKAKNGGTALVHLGPAWYISNQRLQIRIKDKVTVTGSKVFINGKSAILASTVAVGGKLLILRDTAGYALWSAWRPQAQIVNLSQIAGPENLQGEVTGTAIAPDGTATLVIRTPNGDYTVNVAPEWFMQRQDQQFATGDLITLSGVFGNVGPNPPGPPIVIPSYIRRGPDVLILRYINGQPVWMSWR